MPAPKIYKQSTTVKLPPPLARQVNSEMQNRVFYADVTNLKYELLVIVDTAYIELDGEASIDEWSSFMRQFYTLICLISAGKQATV
jgi:hypothetical protein